jgi:hypothetical protein
MDAAMPPALQLAPTTAAAVQSLSNQLLQATLAGRRPVAGVALLYGPHLLWSSLALRDTAGVFALIATGLLHASSSSGSSGGATVSSANGISSAAAAAAETQRSHLRPLDGGSWQQLPSGYLVQRGSLDADISQQGAAAVTVPLVHLQHPPRGGSQQQAAQQAAAGSQRQPYHLLPLLEGKLLVALLLGGDTQLSSGLLASLHGLAAAPAKQLAAQVCLWVLVGVAFFRICCAVPVGEPASQPGDSQSIAFQAANACRSHASAHCRLGKRSGSARQRRRTCRASATCTRMQGRVWCVPRLGSRSAP